jgi:hypothetical protein
MPSSGAWSAAQDLGKGGFGGLRVGLERGGQLT